MLEARARQHAQHAALAGLEHFERVMLAERDDVPDAPDPSQTILNEPADRDGLRILERPLEKGRELVEREPSRHVVRSSADRENWRLLAGVEFVLDLRTDQLLDQILERDEPRRPAVLVHHDRLMEPPHLELAEEHVRRARFGYEQGLARDRLERPEEHASGAVPDGVIEAEDGSAHGSPTKK